MIFFNQDLNIFSMISCSVYYVFYNLDLITLCPEVRICVLNLWIKHWSPSYADTDLFNHFSIQWCRKYVNLVNKYLVSKLKVPILNIEIKSSRITIFDTAFGLLAHPSSSARPSMQPAAPQRAASEVVTREVASLGKWLWENA